VCFDFLKKIRIKELSTLVISQNSKNHGFQERTGKEADLVILFLNFFENCDYISELVLPVFENSDCEPSEPP
jgi:hypothetical protein